MADALALRVKQFIETCLTCLSDDGEAPDSKRMKTGFFDGLMNYLRDMMVGYENEEVLALLEEIKEVVPQKVLYSHGKKLTSHMMPGHMFNSIYMLNSDGQISMTETWLRDAVKRWDKMIVTCEQLCNIRYNTNVEEEKVVVGFEDEIQTLLHQLTGTTKQLVPDYPNYRNGWAWKDHFG
ncbi:hypothetical protein Hanom_Chr12g01096871 [Helianthus anomalus]